MGDEVCIATFPTTFAALRAERAAGEAGFAVRMVPVPREISSDCNMCMEASAGDMQALESLLTSLGVECNFVKWRKY